MVARIGEHLAQTLELEFQPLVTRGEALQVRLVHREFGLHAGKLAVLGCSFAGERGEARAPALQQAQPRTQQGDLLLEPRASGLFLGSQSETGQRELVEDAPLDFLTQFELGAAAYSYAAIIEAHCRLLHVAPQHAPFER